MKNPLKTPAETDPILAALADPETSPLGTRSAATAQSEPERKPGAPTGSANNLRHGLRSKRFGLSLGKSPKWAKHDVAEARKYQAALETELLDRYGAIDVATAGQVVSASIHGLRLRLALKWLAENLGPDGKPLTLEQRIALLNLAGSATDAKDKVVARLFDKPCAKSDPWAVVDAMPVGGQAAEGNDHADR